jgi:hypothetical protein
VEHAFELPAAAALCLQELDKARCGILIGSAFGGMQTFATAVEALELQSERGRAVGSK